MSFEDKIIIVIKNL